MISSDIRKEARNSLKGKWGKAALITLVYTLITYAIQWVLNFIPAVGSIILLVIQVPITYGIVASFMKLKRGEEVSVVDFLTEGFSKFGKAWAVTGNTILKLIVPVIIGIVCLIVASVAMAGELVNGLSQSQSGVGAMVGLLGMIGYAVAMIYAAIKSLYYSLTMYLLKDNEELTGKEIVEKSAELMKGNRWNYVWLTLTFVGWAILAVIPLGIGLLWLIPYVQVAQIVFYEDKAGILNAEQEKEEETTLDS